MQNPCGCQAPAKTVPLSAPAKLEVDRHARSVVLASPPFFATDMLLLYVVAIVCAGTGYLF
jgi:hypothetical protein